MSKPTIHGFCPAGCKYPVPHKEDFDKVESQVTGMAEDVSNIIAGKVGDIIIPHKKLLWSGTETITSSGDTKEIQLNEAINVGDVIEIETDALQGFASVYSKFRVMKIPDTLAFRINECSASADKIVNISSAEVLIPSSTTIAIGVTNAAQVTSSSISVTKKDTIVYKIYKIIE